MNGPSTPVKGHKKGKDRHGIRTTLLEHLISCLVSLLLTCSYNCGVLSFSEVQHQVLQGARTLH